MGSKPLLRNASHGPVLQHERNTTHTASHATTWCLSITRFTWTACHSPPLELSLDSDGVQLAQPDGALAGLLHLARRRPYWRPGAVVDDLGLLGRDDPQHDQAVAVGVHADAVARGQFYLHLSAFSIDRMMAGFRHALKRQAEALRRDHLAD